jgi:hypothetical protein
MRLDGGQVLRLTGAVVELHLGEVRSGTAAPRERMRVTGRVPRSGASVCGANPAFVVDKADAVDGQ